MGFNFLKVAGYLKTGIQVYDAVKSVTKNKDKYGNVLEEIRDLPVAVANIKEAIRDMDMMYGVMNHKMRRNWDTFRQAWKEVEDVVEAVKDVR